MTIIGTSNLPVAPLSTPWNAKAAKARVFEACDGNVACLSRAFLWRFPGDARSPDSYGLPFADVIDGRLHIVPKGIAACAGARGLGTFAVAEEDAAAIRERISAVYDRVRREYESWPVSPFAGLTAAASGTPIAGVITIEDQETGDGRFFPAGAFFWDEGPWPLVLDNDEMDHSGATIGTIDVIERRENGEIWGSGNLSDSQNEETRQLVLRAEELLNEGAVGVSVAFDSVPEEESFPPEEGVWTITKARIRHIAIVDVPAFATARMALAASARTIPPEWFANPHFGGDDDERLVWQEPERPEEAGQLGCPLTITDEGRIYGHAALWGRCHVGYPGTCVRPPKEAAAYRGFLTGERIPGVPTGPLVMKTTHASLKLAAEAASAHYDHSGYAVADVTAGSDAHGIWVAGAVRSDATESDIEMLRGSALSGDWRMLGGQMRLVGLLVVSAPGFRVARSLAASGAMITTGPGCSRCGDEVSLEDRVALLEAQLAERSA